MSSILASQKRMRKSFHKISDTLAMPNLIELQKKSYNDFLQKDIPRDKRENKGLEGVFKSIFPISDFAEKSLLEFVNYSFDTPKYDVEDCKQRGITYAAPLRVAFRLIVWDIDETSGERSIRDIKDQVVYVGDVPLMTISGTFVINGVERVIVSQMHRSPGVFFDHDRGKTHASGKYLFSGRIIPYRGSWLDFEFDSKDILYVRIDRKRKILATTFLMSLLIEEKDSFVDPKGEAVKRTYLNRQDILQTFYDVLTYERSEKGWVTDFVEKHYLNTCALYDLVDVKTGKVLVKSGEKVTIKKTRAIREQNIEKIIIKPSDLLFYYLSEDLIDKSTGEIIATAGAEISEDLLANLAQCNINELKVLFIDNMNVGPYLRDTLVLDKNTTREGALLDIYNVIRPGEPPTFESANALFNSLFFNNDRYDLSAVGRVKINERLNLNLPKDLQILCNQDLIEVVKIMLSLKSGNEDIDDIDNLGNRRVRPVGELVENHYRIGLSRVERSIKERMSSIDVDTIMPHDLINSKPISAVIKEFFATSQLSQFMDQVNPLSEITHKRRLSALGPGGLTRDRANFEVRDVHPTHYGRICPIETPEGPNIGLINSLATYARVNDYGFIESPYRRVESAKITGEVVYLSAIEEARYAIAQSDSRIDDDGNFIDNFVNCRKGGEFTVASSAEIAFIDVSPKQLVSTAASLIPFLENDDANRALMGSNMQRQAVPLIKAEAPIVGTGMESIVARDSGVTVIAKRNGIVDKVDAGRIVVRADESENDDLSIVDIYSLKKFQRSNQDSCVSQKPLVYPGDKVVRGEIIADGQATDGGELALGSNVLVGFLSWRGYNFEDSIIVSERIVKEDVYTSIQIEEFEVVARDTKLGQEEITRDIPNIGDDALRYLDEAGIVSIGAKIKAGDILVGKITPKGESSTAPEEKLLRSIFGEKATDVRDTSLRLPPGVRGTVVEVRVFNRRGLEKDERALAIEHFAIRKLTQNRDAERDILETALRNRLCEILQNCDIASIANEREGNFKLTLLELSKYTNAQIKKIKVGDKRTQDEIESLIDHNHAKIKQIQSIFEDKVAKIQSGDDLQSGVLKVVKVFVATKRKLQPGDKMAGRHGNKGVVSRVIPIEDMPHLEDGTPLDIILNPLGLPSRMNVGQILETHLGWAAHGLGKNIANVLANICNNENDINDLRKCMLDIYDRKEDSDLIKKMSDEKLIKIARNQVKGVPVATPVFDGAKEENINELLKKAGFDTSGQVVLIDGMNGKPFERKVTVGYKYMLKLDHMVDDKIHARSVGPYSLVIQQPLGGKAQFGGQRFGEMEVWALEAYGAAYTLQEMLTVKSDDIVGRTKVYEAIIRGDDNFDAGIPESFNVLVKELKSLCIDVEFGKKDKK